MKRGAFARILRSWKTYVALVAALAFGWLAFGGDASAGPTAAVERRAVSAAVDVTGSVVPVSTAGLGFEQGGRVASVPVEEGQHVAAGQILASLDSAALYADLKDARATLAIAQAEAGNTAESVEKVRAAQDTLVENARRTLRSDGLAFVPVATGQTITPPAVSGSYDGPGGVYKMRVVRSADGSTAFRLFGVEKTDEVIVRAADRAVALGAYGLYVTFPGDLAAYRGTDWTLEIPNRASASYAANLAAYEAAVRERDRAVQAAEADLAGASAESSVAAARVAQAEAAVERAQAGIAARTIRAPFAGLVKTVAVKVGEVAAADAAAVTLISDGAFQVEANLPEVDSTRVRVGMAAAVTVDALLGAGGAAPLAGTVAKVDRAESLDGGVPVYTMTVYLDAPPAELRSGMTAEVVVRVDSRDGVLAVPLAAIELAADGDFVTVVRGGKAARVPVSLGLRGDDGYAEVSGPLAEGDLVVLPSR